MKTTVTTTFRIDETNHKRLGVISALIGKPKQFILNRLIGIIVNRKIDEAEEDYIKRIKKEYDL